jgi:hypothetical protein
MNKVYNIFDMTKHDFDNLEYIDWNKYDTVDYDSLVIIPTNKVHDSGFLCMELVACKDAMPIGILTTVTDSLHLDGLCGDGWEVNNTRHHVINPKAWTIDCLPCGYLRLFSGYYDLKSQHGLSDFEVYACGERR